MPNVLAVRSISMIVSCGVGFLMVTPVAAQPHMSLPRVSANPAASLRATAAALTQAAQELRKDAPAATARAGTPAEAAAVASQMEARAVSLEREAAQALKAAADAEQPASATLFGDLAAAFKTRLSYVRTSLVSGRLGGGKDPSSSASVEVSYLYAVSAKDTIPEFSRDSSNARIATLTGVIQNSGSWAARVLLPLNAVARGTSTDPWSSAADLILEGGYYGPDDQPLGAGGVVAEYLITASLFGSDTKPLGKLMIGGQASAHIVNGGRLFPEMEKGPVYFAQAFLLVKQNDAIALGLSANAINKSLRVYYPSLQLIVKADVGKGGK